MRNPVRAFVCGPLIAGLMLVAASSPTHAQTLDTVVGERVAAVAREASRAGQPARRFDLTLDDAVQRALERNLDIADYPVWSVQLQMSYPLGRSADRAAYERARLELQQNRTQIRRIELRIASEVTNAALRIESIRERIEAATASRELAERQLEAEESKFEVGLSTNFFVLQSQRDLANAQDAELRAVLDYQRALIEFDRTQRASLGAAGIAVVGGAMGGGAGAIY
ncbi:MAG: TolC family protein [Acidobacteriota bacterium]|nr:TolC family protein [Acidobacteriota bacterium]